MSGIFGFLDSSRSELALPMAHHMSARMRHHAYFTSSHASPLPELALGRIGIGIFNAEPGPVRSADGEVWLYLCGEFYHQQQRRAFFVASGALQANATDANFALQVYLHAGVAGVLQLDGAFTLAIWDNRTRELTLVNDRFGLYPHYIAHVGSVFAFAPEMKALAALPAVPRRLNMTALAEYVRFQQLLGDKTWFEDIQLLPPASLLRYRPDDNQLTMTRYWDWHRIETQPTIGFDEGVEEAIRLFQRAIDAMTAPPFRPGVYLSGGLDGRIILGFINRQIAIHTITFGDPDCRDMRYAARLAQRAGSAHHAFPFTNGHWVQEHAPLHLALTEGMHNWMHAHGISTLPKARTLIDVNLSGWDGATTMGGFAILEDYQQDRYYRHAPDEASLTQRLFEAFCQKISWPGLTEGEAATLFGRNAAALNHLAFESIQREISRTQHYPADRRVDYFFIHHGLRRGLQNQIITARSAIEVRCPYFDYDFVTFMYSLPSAVRVTPAFRQAIVTRRMPQLATVPYEKNNRLPHSNGLLYHAYATMQRTKRWVNRHIPPLFPDHTRLYADYEHYLRTDLRAWAEAILFDPRTEERGFFDPQVVRSLWKRHLGGEELWTVGKIAPLMTLELVMRTMFDEPTLPTVATMTTPTISYAT
jgi:asparagine synthase (glutamine-hydrolysing)